MTDKLELSFQSLYCIVGSFVTSSLAFYLKSCTFKLDSELGSSDLNFHCHGIVQ